MSNTATAGGGTLSAKPVPSGERLHYLDTARGIVLLLVIFGHCGLPTTCPPLERYLASFRMPFFFVLSGVLLALKEERRGAPPAYELKKKLRAYILPFYAFGLLNIVVHAPILLIRDGWQEAWTTAKNLFLNLLRLNGDSAIWFLPCLFLTEVLFIFLRRHFSRKWLFLPVLVLGVLGCVLPNDRLLWRVYGHPLVGVVFFTVGYLAAPHRDLARKKSRWVPAAMLAAALAHLSLVLTLYHIGWEDISVNISGMKLGRYPVFFFLEGALASLLVLAAAARYLPRAVPFLTRFGRNTMAPLCLHQLMLRAVLELRARIPQILPGGGVAYSILLFVYTMILTLPASLAIERWAPFLLGRPRRKKTPPPATSPAKP